MTSPEIIGCSIDQPENIVEFRKCDNPTTIIPELPMNRKVTDKKYLFIFGLFIVLFIPFLIYALVNSNINEMFRASSKISPHEQIKQSTFVATANDLYDYADKIVKIFLFGSCLTVGMFLFFLYYTAVVIWTILLVSMFSIIGFTIFLWIIEFNTEYSYSTYRQRKMTYFMTLLSIISPLVLIGCGRKINLVIRLFQESIRVMFKIPLILLQPLLTFLTLIILYIIYFYVLFCMESSRTFSSSYELSGLTIFSLFYYSVIVIWMHGFIVGCQHMVISGLVSSYYFTRDKASLSLKVAICNSFKNLFNCHLGTVALGSLMLILFSSLRGIFCCCCNRRKFEESCSNFLMLMSKKAYIQTAMHGQPFFRSSKRAVQLLATNPFSVIAVNWIGDFVLGMIKLIICISTVVFAMFIFGTNLSWLGMLIGVVVTIIIANCFFTVFEVAVDTTFLCFCEDMCMNDGVEQPYYMSVNLMQYAFDAAKVYLSENTENS